MSGATSPVGTACPQGSYCVQGNVFQCPEGTYGTNAGGSSLAGACALCPPNTYSAARGATSFSTCSPCPRFENSSAGATTCWPGIIGLCTFVLSSLCLRISNSERCVAVQTWLSAIHHRPFPASPWATSSQCTSLASQTVLMYQAAQRLHNCSSSRRGLAHLCREWCVLHWHDAEPDACCCRQCCVIALWPLQWALGSDAAISSAAQRLAIVIGGTVNKNKTDTAIGNATIRLLASGGLRDASGLSQVAFSAHMPLTGSWGLSSQPSFMSTVRTCQIGRIVFVRNFRIRKSVFPCHSCSSLPLLFPTANTRGSTVAMQSCCDLISM